MATEHSETTDRTTTEDYDGSGLRSRARRIAAGAADRAPTGSAAMLAGGALLARAARTAARNRRRAAAQALAGAALLGLALRRRSGDDATDDGDETEPTTEAQAHRDRADVPNRHETNPRGTSDDPAVETETDPDEGSMQFLGEGDDEPQPRPHPDEGPEDPRDVDEDETDGEAAVDVSEAAMADEASEATGPTPEQAPEADASHVEADQPDGTDESDSGTETDESAGDEAADEAVVPSRSETGGRVAAGLAIDSSAFDDGGRIPPDYGREEKNTNPPLRIDGVPDDAESLALIVDDPDAPGGAFDHWVVWNIPPDTLEITLGWSSEAAVEGQNGYGETGYAGPDPPEEHTYRFTLYALDDTLDLGAGATSDEVRDAMADHVIEEAQLTGTYAP